MNPLLKHASERVDNFIQEIMYLRRQNFPLESSTSALDRLLTYYEKCKNDLEAWNSATDQSKINSLIQAVLGPLSSDHTILGFINRSANARNPFELKGPFESLARKFLDPNFKVLLSSEWNYSPHVLDLDASSTHALREYLLFGFPVSDANNPFIAPIFGHEIGHPLWRIRDMFGFFSPWAVMETNKALPELEEKLSTALSSKSHPTPTIDPNQLAIIVISKVAELFCDAIGQAIFGPSFLAAVGSFSASFVSNLRSRSHPPDATRIKFLKRLSGEFHQEIIIDWERHFPEPRPAVSYEDHVLEISDGIAEKSEDLIIERVKEIVVKPFDQRPPGGDKWPDIHAINNVIEEFKAFAPPGEAVSLPVILNAGWRFRQAGYPGWDQSIPDGKKLIGLQELILKSCEISFLQEQISGMTP